MTLPLVTDNRATLYYGKYRYKVLLNLVVSSAAELRRLYLSYNKGTPITSVVKRNTIFDTSTHTRDFANIFKIVKKYDLPLKTTSYSDAIAVFTTDINVVKLIHRLYKSKCIIYNATPTSEFTIYFKRTPPANHRLFLTGGIINHQEFVNFIEYIDRNDQHIVPSRSLMWYINSFRRRNLNHTRVWLSTNYYLNITDDTHISMLYLKFPSLFSKLAKLEKVP